MRITLLAAACGLAFTSFARAEAEYTLDDIVVTAKRFEQGAIEQPAQIRVLNRADIAASGALSIPEVLAQAAGLSVRSLYGGFPGVVELDARGYGETGNSHVLVLLDGRRLNAPDSQAVENWSAIPLASIERIEIQYGSGTVLYGDNAVGAVVNLITRQRAAARSNVALRSGSFNTNQVNAGIDARVQALNLRLDASLGHTDAYRAHNEADNGSLAGRMLTTIGQADVAVDFGYGELDAQLPGYLTLAQALADPGASFPGNGQGQADRRNWHVRPGATYALGDGLKLSGELGYESSRTDSAISYDMGGGFLATSLVDNRYHTVSFTPRLNMLGAVFGAAADTVIGLDYYRTEFDSTRDYFGQSRIGLTQDSVAVYGQSSLRLRPDTVVTVGARRQEVDQGMTRTGATDLANDQARTAWDVGISKQFARGPRLYARHGEVFRFAKSDELTTFDGLGVALRPEHGRSSELGMDWTTPAYRWQIGLFSQDLRDEIAYNANPDGDWSTWDGRNENLQNTRHDGVTVDASLVVRPGLTARMGYAYTDARFSDGPDDGKTLPLVPRQQGNVGLRWQPGGNWTVDGLVNWSASRYYGSDSDNSSPRLDGYTTVDLTATWRRGPWSLQMAGKNLGDEHYATSGFEYLLSQYPADGRAVYLSLAHEGGL